MTIYIFVCIFPFIAYFISRILFQVDEKLYRCSFLIILFIALFLIAGLRDISVGGDLENYLPEFNNISELTFSSLLEDGYNDREILYALFEKTISIWGTDSTFYLFCTSFVILFISFLSIYKYSQNVFLSSIIFILYLYTTSLNLLRASICIALCLYSFKYIVNRNLHKFCITILIACMIQKTTITFFPAYFLYGRKENIKLLAIVVVGSIIASYYLTGNALVNIIQTYASYFKLEDTSEALSDSSNGLSMFTYYLLLLLVLLVYIKKKRGNDDIMFSFFINLMTIAIVIQVFSPIFSLFNRICAFYFSYMVLVIPYIQKNYFRNYFNYFLIISISGFVYMYFAGILNNAQAIYPYKFVFE